MEDVDYSYAERRGSWRRGTKTQLDLMMVSKEKEMHIVSLLTVSAQLTFESISTEKKYLVPGPQCCFLSPCFVKVPKEAAPVLFLKRGMVTLQTLNSSENHGVINSSQATE